MIYSNNEEENTMQVQVNIEKNVEHGIGLDEHVQEVVQAAIGRFGEQITRVEVHIGDTNGQKGGPDDKRCMMEARVNGLQPIAVTDHGSTLHQAIGGAADKLKRAVDTAIAKRSDIRHDKPVAELVQPEEE